MTRRLGFERAVVRVIKRPVVWLIAKTTCRFELLSSACESCRSRASWADLWRTTCRLRVTGQTPSVL